MLKLGFLRFVGICSFPWRLKNVYIMKFENLVLMYFKLFKLPIYKDAI